MLRPAGIRSKILAVLVVPLALLGVTAGALATQQVDRAAQAYEVETIAETGGPFGQLVRGIAAERAATAGALQGDPASVEALPTVRAQVDQGLAASREAVGEVDFARLSPQSEEALDRVQAAHVELGIVRETVDRGGASLDDVMGDFGDILAEDLAMPGRVARGVDDPATADLLTGFGHLLTTRDLALREQEAGLRILAGDPTPGDVRDLPMLATGQSDEVALWEYAVGSEAAAEVADLVGEQRQTVWSIGRARVALSSPATVRQTGLTPEIWLEATDDRVAGLDAALADITADVTAAGSAASQRSSLLAALAVAAAVLGVGVTVLLSLLLARRITRPLRELTAAATSVREQLPLMVEQMRSPGQMPDVSLPHIEVHGDDEVARLAAAFNAVNDTVVQVAEEQAALRGAIAETFVNVARRNQVLLSRQLAFIDRLEQREENPDTLENLFRLDHLATRMRRNAESLLVLANIDAGRRLRQPLALSDVIRTAAGEIEQYERVHLALQVDPPTVGHLSLQLAHLLAELLENGTNFSEPHTRVVVGTSRTAEGIRITVTDEGLGLTEEEIESARGKISVAAADDVVTSQRLGFFVVGRLARRLGVTVGIQRGTAKGLVVTVDLPPSLFVPGTVTIAAPAPVEGLPTAPAAPTVPASPADAPPADAPPALPAVPQPRPAAAVPAARRSPSPAIPMPTTTPVDGPVPPVTVTPGGPVLPRRGQAAAAVDPPDSSDERTGATVEAPRRSGLFGAFRARADAPEQAPAAPSPRSTERATDRARPSNAVPESAAPAPARSVPSAAPASAPPAPPTPPTLPTPPTPPTPPTAQPVDILPGAGRRRGRRSMFGPGRGAAPTAASPAVPSTAGRPAGPISPRNDAPSSGQLPATPSPAGPQPASGRPSSVPAQGTGPVRQAAGGTASTAPASSFPSTGSPLTAGRAANRPAAPGPVPPAPVGTGPGAPCQATAGPAAPAPGPAPSGPAPSGPANLGPATRGPVASGPAAPGATPGPALPRLPMPSLAMPSLAMPGAAPAGSTAPGSGLRRRAEPAHGLPQQATPVVPGLPDGEAVRQRSMLASEALSELSRLSAYSPSAVAGTTGPAPLTRRQPAASEAARVPEPTAPSPDRRPRDAADVRSMLSGFQSGVARGRGADTATAAGDAPSRTSPTETNPAGTGPTETGPTGTSPTDTRTTD